MPKDKIGPWQALRDIFREAIVRGQLPALGVLLVLVIVAARLDPKDLSEIVKEVVHHALYLHLLGWLLWLLTVILWFYSARRERKFLMDEVRRLAKERTEWQRMALGKEEVKSSGGTSNG